MVVGGERGRVYFSDLDDKWSPLPGEFRRKRWKIDGPTTAATTDKHPLRYTPGVARRSTGFKIFLHHRKHERPLRAGARQVQPHRHGLLSRDDRMFNNEEQSCGRSIAEKWTSGVCGSELSQSIFRVNINNGVSRPKKDPTLRTCRHDDMIILQLLL